MVTGIPPPHTQLDSPWAEVRALKVVKGQPEVHCRQPGFPAPTSNRHHLAWGA